MRNPPASADPVRYPDDPSIVSILIENGAVDVGMYVNAWEARQMATKLRQIADSLLRVASKSMN